MDALIALASEQLFIEYPDHHVTHLPVRLYRFWIRLVSFLLTQFLHRVEKPMCHLGYCIEQILNLLSHNGGLLGIIFRVLTGRGIIIPQRDSETFRSAIGYLDPRLDLDKREITVLNGDCNSGTAIIQAGSRYCAEVCVMASKLAYENELFVRNVVTKRWKMHFVEFFDCWNNYLGKNSTQAFLFCDKRVDARLVVVAFRGTGPFDADDWITDFDLSWHKMGSLGKVHVGFLEAMGLANRSNKKMLKTPSERKREDIIHDHDNAELPDECVTEDEKKPLAYYAIRKKLSTLLEEHKDAKFIVTGHSLGGALAILFPAILLLHKKTKLMNKLLAVHTFGQPRVGDRKFGDFMNMNLNEPVTRYFRTVYCNDMIPRIPYDDEALSFKHCGVCLYYNSFYKQKMVKEVPNRNFSMLYYIPSMITATWELLYSLIMPYTKGKDFSEGWFALCFRFMGILLPGMSAHSPLNYVNAIRLGPALFHTDLTVTDEDSDIDGIETPLINGEEGRTEMIDCWEDRDGKKQIRRRISG